jgi:hypothetical protein
VALPNLTTGSDPPAGDFFGAAGVLSGEPFLHSVVAASAGKSLVVEKAHLER